MKEIRLPRRILMDRCPNRECRAIAPSSCYCPTLLWAGFGTGDTGCEEANKHKHYHRTCMICMRSWIVFSLDPIRSLARLAADRNLIEEAVEELRFLMPTPEDAARALAHLRQDVALDLLRRAAEATGGWTPQLDRVGLLLLKPGAPVGEEVSA